MQQQPVQQRVKRVIVDKTDVSLLLLVREANFTTDLGLDSLTLVELVMEIEKEFEIEIPDDQAERIQTVGDLISFVEVRLFNKDGWGFSDPSSPIELDEVVITRSYPQNHAFKAFDFYDFSNKPGDNISIGTGANYVYRYKNIVEETPEPEDDCNDPLKPPYLTCEQWLLMNGHGFISWVSNQDSFRVYKPTDWLDSEALKNGMTVAGYINDRLKIIIQSIGPEQVKNLGSAVRGMGLLGAGFSGYKLYTAVSDGNITTSDVLAGVSVGLGVITLVPGVGTAIGLGGQILLSAGSLMFGIVSDHVDESVLIDFNVR